MKTNRQIVVCITTVALLIAIIIVFIYILIGNGIDGHLFPPEQCSTIEQFSAWLDEPEAIVRIRLGSDMYYVIFGGWSNVPVAERPAGYLFDSTGKLIAWSIESQDVDAFGVYWELARAAVRRNEQLSYQAVIEGLE